MHEDYLKKGLIGLSNTLDSGYATDRGWFAGHWPCAVIAAYYFCRNNPIEAGVDEAVSKEVDILIGKHPKLFKPFVEDNNVDKLTANEIAQALKNSITSYMVSGHNVIYAAYVLQVLADKPEYFTLSMLNHLYELVKYFSTRKDGIKPTAFFAEGKKPTLVYENQNQMLQNVYECFHHAPRVPEQGRLLFDGHLTTHAHALIMISRLGYDAVSRLGLDSHRVHMEMSRNFKSQSLGEKNLTKVTVLDHPFTLAFWERDFQQFNREWEFGHVFKYLYSFYDTIDQIKDPRRKQSCELQLSYLI